MYSCVMGLTEAEANGCILADEMGLGKTLQTIALIYTLLSKLLCAEDEHQLIPADHTRTIALQERESCVSLQVSGGNDQ